MAVRFQNQINENAKQMAHVNTFPEMNHNEIVGWQFPESVLQQAQVIYLYSDHDHERVEKRMEICREIFEKRSNPIIDIVAEGASLLEQYYYLIHLTDWISYYLAKENGIDPDPVEAVDFVKGELSKLKWGMSIRIGILILLLINFVAQAQPTIDTKQSLRHGDIVFNDGTVLTCDYAYNPIVNEGLLFVKQNDLTIAYGVTKVKSFSFFDEEMNGIRYFYNLPIYNSSGGAPLGRYFFESIYDNKIISVLGRMTVKTKSNIMSKAKYDKKYLLDHRNGQLYPLSKKKMIELIGDKEEVMNYMYMKHYKLHEKDIDQYFTLIDLYSRL